MVWHRCQKIWVLRGPVNRDTFVAILEGQLPDGTDMRRMKGGENTHRPGYDLTLSAPQKRVGTDARERRHLSD